MDDKNIHSTQPASADPQFETPKSFPTSQHPLPHKLPKSVAAVILIVLFLVAFVTTSRMLYQGKIKTTYTQPSPSPSFIETKIIDTNVSSVNAKWKTYTNEKYSYTLRYPDTWSVEETKIATRSDDDLVFKQNISIGPVSTENHIGETVPPYVSNAFFNVTIFEDPKNTITNLVQFLDEYKDFSPEIQEITLDGYKAFVIYHAGSLSGQTIDIYLEKDNLIYNMRFAENASQYRNELDQILSTFKFLSNTSDWKTYTSTKYGYSIQYPPDSSLTITPEQRSEGYRELIRPEIVTVSNDEFGSLSFPSLPLDWMNEKSEEVIVDGKEGTLNYLRTDTRDSSQQIFVHVPDTLKDAEFFGIQYTIPKINNEKHLNYLRTILSTVKFIDQATTSPTCSPRPACLDAEPRCLLPETPDMCPPKL